MRKALVVGINDYPSSPLYGCINDAKAVGQLIETNGNGDPNFTVKIAENVATKSRLKTLIQELFESDSDIALFYFSGHGCIDHTGGYLVTPDYSQNDAGVSMDDIITITNNSSSKNRVIILDCCHSGVVGSPATSGSQYAQLKEGVTILTSCRKGETSLEVKSQGVFTSLLLDALNGGAADVQGHITPGSIYAYIDQALGAWQQRPVFKTNITRFTLLRSVTPHVPKSVLRKITTYFPRPDFEYQLNPSYEVTNSSQAKQEPVAPFADKENVDVFKKMQLLESVGLVVPVDEKHMYHAAMNSKACKLTALGAHYWRLANNKSI